MKPANNSKNRLYHSVPSHQRALRPQWLSHFSQFYLETTGWQIVGDIPKEKKLILVLGPHTSNWDFFMAMFIMTALDIRISWLAKKSIFKWPVKRMLTALGGVPVNRAHPQGFTTDIAQQLQMADQLIIAIMPEGTRSKVAQLKTGFSRIAHQVPCPILPVTMDYKKKQIQLLPLMTASKDPQADAVTIRALFAQAEPKHPQNF